MTTEQQKTDWLKEHLPYELKMVRYSRRRLGDRLNYLQWNAHLQSFATSARNVSHFLTNDDKGNLKASDYIQEFRSTKGNVASKFAQCEPQIFHLGKSRPQSTGKITFDDVSVMAEWIEEEMRKFLYDLKQIDQTKGTNYSSLWDEAKSRPEPDADLVVVLGGPLSTSTADPVTSKWKPGGQL
ncbi:MAG: hypothetical protein QM780_05105 [Hyphomicrobium sp.]|uniref:hypothetical protein n=1 Tax=Hyphomicrobium sp. TaxID=82 RepID=UPI0039E5877D